MNKKLILVGLLVAGAVIAVKASSGKTEAAGNDALLIDRGFAITYPGAPNGATFLVYQGKKYAFISQEAFVNFGYTQPVISTQQEVDSYPKEGFVGADGRVWNEIQRAVILGNAQDA